jgi:hypothetical protein
VCKEAEMAEAEAVAVLDAVVSEEARAMLEDVLPMLQEVQLQEEIVRVLNQQLLQSKQMLMATQDKSSRAHEEFVRATSNLQGHLQRQVTGSSSTKKLCAA